MKKTIIYFAANPSDIGRLRTDKELTKIQDVLKSANGFQLIPRFATQPKNIIDNVLEYEPNVHIFHFSGHGTPDGIIVETQDGKGQKVISAYDLKELFQNLCVIRRMKIDCAIFNACMSKNIGTVVGEYIPFVIGTTHHIADEDAINFSTGFYDRLSKGEDILLSFFHGRLVMRLEGNFTSNNKFPLIIKTPNGFVESPSQIMKLSKDLKQLKQQQESLQKNISALKTHAETLEVDLLRESKHKSAASWLTDHRFKLAESAAEEVLLGYPKSSDIVNQYMKEIKLFLDQLHAALVVQDLSFLDEKLVKTTWATHYYIDGFLHIRALFIDNKMEFNQETVVFLEEGINYLIAQLTQ